MKSFIKQRKILDETLSDRLRKKRQEKGIDLHDVSKDLNINIKYLEAIENNRIEDLPPGVYGKSFLKKYAYFLEVSMEDLDDTLNEEDVVKKKDFKDDLFSKKVPSRRYFLSTPKIIKNILIVLVVCFFLVYLGFFINNIISPPKLFISNPKEDLSTHKRFIEISGQTESEVQIYINENLVLVDVGGFFSKKISLKEGLNLVVVTAQKKYSKKNVIVRKILVN